MTYIDLFPASYSASLGRYRPSAMVSYSYGPKSGDPRPNDVIIEDVSKHPQVFEWIRKSGHMIFVWMLGDGNHGPIHNVPTTILVMFLTESSRDKFITEVIDANP